MTGNYKWIKDEKDADFLYGGENFVISDADIERLKNGEILNFFVNEKYGCTLKYETEESRVEDCEGCMYENISVYAFPCNDCKNSHKDYWRPNENI